MDYNKVKEHLYKDTNLFRIFLNTCRIKNSFIRLPAFAMRSVKMFDQAKVNIYMARIVDDLDIAPVVISKDHIILDGTNRFRAYNTLNKMIPTITIDISSEDEFKHLIFKFIKWCESDGVKHTADEWLRGEHI